MEYKLASKSWKIMARIWSIGVCRRASPRLRRGPMAASLARAVMSEPEKPGNINQKDEPERKKRKEKKGKEKRDTRKETTYLLSLVPGPGYLHRSSRGVGD